MPSSELPNHAVRRMRTRVVAVSGILIGIGAALTASHLFADDPVAESPTETAATNAADSASQVSRWIEELSHDAFTVRQAAAARLLASGMAARDPLLAIVNGPDPETRAAARRLVALIDRTEFQRRLEAFAADIDGQKGLTLPGWEPFRERVGGDPAARALFVEMQRQEGPLIAAAFGVSSRPPEELWEMKIQRLIVQQQQTTTVDRSLAPSLGSCAALVFLGSVSEIQISETGAQFVETIINRSPIRESLQAESPHDAVRRLVVSWILHCPNRNEEILKQRLNLISATGLNEALPLALDVVRDPKFARVQPMARAYAVHVIGLFGGPEHVNGLEPLLEDASSCIPAQAQLPGQLAPTVQVRDVALVVMLQLTKQKPADYGYVSAPPQTPRNIQIQTLCRDTDKDRTDAIAKWRQWREAEKTRVPEKP